MPDFAAALGASKAASALLALFIPSKDRSDKAINQRFWVEEALSTLGTLFGGATAFPKGKGYGVTTPRGASSCLMSRLSSTATQVPTCLSKKCKCCGNFCTAWDARHGKERSDWLLTTNTLRSDSRWKKPRRPSNRKSRNGGK